MPKEPPTRVQRMIKPKPGTILNSLANAESSLSLKPSRTEIEQAIESTYKKILDEIEDHAGPVTHLHGNPASSGSTWCRNPRGEHTPVDQKLMGMIDECAKAIYRYKKTVIANPTDSSDFTVEC